MDAAGRKAFWDTLCSLHTYDHESARKLIEASPCPQELCRFRAVNEDSLLRLQNNELLFSRADYYKDPFDTFFSINFKALQECCNALKLMLAQNDTGIIRDLLTKYGLGNNLDSIIQFLKSTDFDMNWLKLSLKDVRKSIQKQIHSICFCEDPLNKTMWLHYADNHEGFVQIYDFNDPNTILCGKEQKCAECGVNKYPPVLYPIYYSNEMYDATAYALNVLAREVFKKELPLLPPELHKASSDNAVWQREKISLIKEERFHYEQEWRMLLPTPYTNRPCIKLKPRSVLIGLYTPEYKKRLIISAARTAGIQEIYQVVINDDNLLGKQRISEE